MVLKTLHTYRVAISAALACLCLLMLGGCSGNPQFTDYHAFVSEPRLAAPAKTYLLGPPDVIEIRSARVRELSNYRQTISPDGILNIPLLGDVYAAGRSINSLQEELEDRARFYYQDADVNIRVAKYASKKLFVFGQVQSPGAYFYNGSNTVLNTLASARPTELADPTAVLIVRPDENGELRARMTVNLDEMIRVGDTTLNSTLEDGDIIYVPPTGVAKVTLAFRQLLLPFAPISQTINGPADVVESSNGRRPYGDE